MKNMTYGERLRAARKNKKLSQIELSELSGVGQGSISKIERGDQDSSTYDVELAFALDVNPLWLKNGNQKFAPNWLSINATLPGLQADINISPGPTVHGKVPLISWVQAGHALEVVDLLQPGQGFDWIDTTCQIRRHTYALRVQGDSMTPDFPEGCIIVVEPDMEPLPGDYVIAKNGDEEATFKQLIKDGADYYLKPMNERYPIKPLGHYRVVGVVRELVRRFR